MIICIKIPPIKLKNILVVFLSYGRGLFMFKRKLAESFVGNISTLVLNLIFPLVATKLYGSELLGRYTYGISVVTMTIFLATLGLGTGLLYFIPREGNKYVTSSFVVNFIASMALIVALWGFTDDMTVKYMLPLIWLLSAEQLFFAIYRSKQNIKEFFKINVIVGIVLKIVLTAVLFKVFGKSTTGIIAATYISLGLCLILYFMGQKDMFGKFEMTFEVIKYSLPLIVGSMMSVIIYNIDSIMIGKMLGKQEVAVYNVAANFATLPSILLRVVNTVFPPMVAKLYHDENMEELRRLYKKTARSLAALSLVIVTLLIFFRNFILSKYGAEFLIGGDVIVYRGIGQLFNASVGSVWYIICMTGRTKIHMAGQMIAAVLNVILNYLLIPGLGISGAAIASMGAVVFSNILGYLIVRRILKVKLYGII